MVAGRATVVGLMRRRLIGGMAAAASMLLLAGPVSAHGDHDARPLARYLVAGPYGVSLWQVYPDAGMAMTPHLIVMVDDTAAPPADVGVIVAVDSRPMEVRPSTTTVDAWETTAGMDEGDVVAVTISAGGQRWSLAPVTVPPPPTSMIPMPELIYTSIFLTAATAWWVLRRTARAWGRPVLRSGTSHLSTGGSTG